MVARACSRIVGAGVLALASACGSAPPPVVEAPKPVEDEGSRRPAAPSTTSEIGGMDETRVTQTFQHLATPLSGCYEKGQQRIAYLAGEVRLAVRVSLDGSTRWAFVKDSTLGDRETELCMLAVLKRTTWPKPQGGEGLAENPFTFEASADERPPVAWSPKQLGPAARSVKAALAKCRKQAGTKAIKATMYVETDGKATAVGVSSADEKGEAAADCVIDALKGIKFPSPGSFASKVTVSTE
jgi:hypothetical protein